MTTRIEAGPARLGHVLKRIALMAFGYGLAAVAAGAVALIFGFNNGRIPELLPGLAATGLVSAHAALWMTPALVAFLAAEIFRLRSLVFFLALGLAGGAAGYWHALWEQFEFSDHPLAAAVGAGVVAAFVYWLVAGRRAGFTAEGA